MNAQQAFRILILTFYVIGAIGYLMGWGGLVMSMEHPAEIGAVLFIGALIGLLVSVGALGIWLSITKD